MLRWDPSMTAHEQVLGYIQEHQVDPEALTELIVEPPLYLNLIVDLGNRVGTIYPFHDGGIRMFGPFSFVTVKPSEYQPRRIG